MDWMRIRSKGKKNRTVTTFVLTGARCSPRETANERKKGRKKESRREGRREGRGERVLNSTRSSPSISDKGSPEDTCASYSRNSLEKSVSSSSPPSFLPGHCVSTLYHLMRRRLDGKNGREMIELRTWKHVMDSETEKKAPPYHLSHKLYVLRGGHIYVCQQPISGHLRTLQAFVDL